MTDLERGVEYAKTDYQSPMYAIAKLCESECYLNHWKKYYNNEAFVALSMIELNAMDRLLEGLNG